MTVTAGHALCLILAGDIDMTGETELADLTDVLATTQCSRVYIDLHEITFAGSSLINFLAHLATRLPGHATMTLCRPHVVTQWLLELTGLAKVATIRGDLPPEWTGFGRGQMYKSTTTGDPAWVVQVVASSG